MARRAPPRTGRKESIADLVKDLELLHVDSKDCGETKESMAKARDLRIEELKKSNGTLLEVCFSYVHKTFTSYRKHFQISQFSLDNSGSRSVVSLILRLYSDKSSQTSTLFDRIGYSLVDRRILNLLIIVFKTIISYPPEYLRDLFRLKDNIKNLRGVDKLQVPGPNTTRYGKNSVKYLAAITDLEQDF